MAISETKVQTKIEAIIARSYQSLSFTDTLSTFGLNAQEFWKGAEVLRRKYQEFNGLDEKAQVQETQDTLRGMKSERYQLRNYPFYEEIARRVSPEAPDIIEMIVADEGLFKDMFDMGEKFIREQYDALLSGEQEVFYSGTLQHKQNLRDIVYYAFIKEHKDIDTWIKAASACEDLDSKKYARNKLINSITKMTEEHSDLKQYFISLRLGGLMSHEYKSTEDPNYIVLCVITLFDEIYMQKTGDVSLFDLTHESHLHVWDPFVAPGGEYWFSEENRINAIYHCVTELSQNTAHEDRDTAIDTFLQLPSSWKTTIVDVGLSGIFNDRDGELLSNIDFFRYFDIKYKQITDNPGLFDPNQQRYLQPSKRGLSLVEN